MERIKLVGGRYCEYVLFDGFLHFPDVSSKEPVTWLEPDAFHVNGWIYRVANGEARFVVQNMQIAAIEDNTIHNQETHV